jgi:hypothetical protein
LTDVSIEIARPEDDLAIQRLLADNPTPGRVALSFEHSPSYFVGCQTMGSFCQVIVGRQQSSGEVVGMACRATRPRYVNGHEEEVGYLTHLRIDRRYRGRWLVSRGYRFVRQLHSDGRVTGYITIVGEDNTQALGVLVERPRGSIPAYRQLCRLSTLGLIVRRPKPTLVSPYEIRRGSREQLPAIVGCLRRSGAEKQFFPVYTEADFEQGASPTLGFQVEDFFVAYDKGQAAGVVGLWDRSQSKQTVVRSYTGWLAWTRPMCNLGAHLLGARPLPPPGHQLSIGYASFVCVNNNDPELFRVLLRHVYNLAAERRYALLIVDLAEHDPLLPVASAYAHVTFHRGLYSVSWEENAGFHEKLDGRIPYVETAAL